MANITDTLLQARIMEAKDRSLCFLKTLQANDFPKNVLKTSIKHDEKQYPQMCLPATYDSLMCHQLLGSLSDHQSENKIDNKDELAAWILSHQTPDGYFEFKSMDWSEFYKKPDPLETKMYTRFHLTNYCLGALESLGKTNGSNNQIKLSFITPFLDSSTLWEWLGKRDMRDPWFEGNNIVNLASFLIHEGSAAAKVHLAEMIEWHRYWAEPYSGFWGPGQQFSQEALLFSLCGATHNFHLFFHENQKIDHINQSISRCLEQPIAVRSACIDVDIVDILANGAYLCPNRSDEISYWLRNLLIKLLDFQNPDGGFADTLLGQRRFDGWVKGYQEPQGISNTFGTWFRWIAIAMIADVLWPSFQQWHFKKNIGVGYFKNYH